MMTPVENDPLSSLPPPSPPPEDEQLAQTASRAFAHHAQAAHAPLAGVRRVWWRRLEPILALLAGAGLLAWAVAWLLHH